MGNVITVELGLPGLEVIGQEEGEGGEIVVLVQCGRTRMDCPRCKRPTAKVHDRRLLGCRDLALRDRRVRLRVVRRRFRCPRCKVRSRSGRYRPLVFGEVQEAIGRGPKGRSRRTTARLRQQIARLVVHQTVKSAAAGLGVGERFARECFREWAEGTEFDCLGPGAEIPGHRRLLPQEGAALRDDSVRPGASQGSGEPAR